MKRFGRMPKLLVVFWLGLLVWESHFGRARTADAGASEFKSPMHLLVSEDQQTLFVCETTGQALAVIDTENRGLRKRIRLPENPTGAAILDSNRLLVTAGAADGVVLEVDVESSKVSSIQHGLHAPVAPVVDAKRKRIYVADRYRSSIVVMGLDGRVIERVAVSREPCAAVMTPDGRALVVAHELPDGTADGQYLASKVVLIDLDSLHTVTLELPNGSNSLRDVCVDADGRFAYVTHVLARYRLPTTQLERGWMNTNAVTVIDVPEQRVVNTVLLDEIDRGAANPWGVAVDGGGSRLCVAHAGTQEISVIDRADLHHRLNEVAAGRKVTEVSNQAKNVPNDLAFLAGGRQRIDVNGNGARSLVIFGDTVAVAMFFTDEIAFVDLSGTNPKQVGRLKLGDDVEMTPQRRGEMFFHDASLCFQTWQSCSSCHPSDGRVDGLNWDLLNDGIGNPKNTKSLLLSHQTPPAMALGVRANAEAAVRAGIRHIQFAVRPEADASAIDEYLKSLRPMPSPHRIDGQLSEAAQRGREVFATSGCIHCHAGPNFTEGNAYDVGTGLNRERGKRFDTPSLVEVWRTAPYLHDGRAATIEDVLVKFNENDRHGRTSELSDEQVNDLVAYVLSL